MHDSTISFAHFEAFFLKIPMIKKNFFQRRGITSPLQGQKFASVYTKIIYDHTIAIINKWFELKND